jgi:tripartite-type tricarboxylate transporter receptor subunit TctC
LSAQIEDKGAIMKIPRREFLRLAAGAAALSAVPRIARAQAYPTRPVRVVVGLPAGTATDITARLISQWLSQRLGQPFVIENLPGADSNIATEKVVKAAPDGYTLLEISSANAQNASVYDNLHFHFIRDIVPVAGIYRAPLVVAVSPSVPARTLPEFIAYAKANPGKVNMASLGVGSVQHLAGEMFKSMAGVDMLHVPYRGNPMPDLLGGQVQVLFSPIAGAIEYIKAGTLRALAVTSATRSALLPDTPTVADFVRGYEANGFNGIGSPKNTPAAVIDELNKEINAGLGDPAIKARFAALGTTVTVGSPADFANFIADETEKWARVVHAANIKLD